MGTFQEATAVVRRGDVYETDLDPQWSVGGKLHGGYLLAVMGRAACDGAAKDHPHPSVVSGAFVAAPAPGPAEIHVELLRTGRSTTQVRARLTQGDAVRVEALITLERLEEVGPWWSGLEPVDLPAEQECPRTPPEAPGGAFPVPLMEVIEQRLDPGHLGFWSGSPSRRGVIAGWQRLADGSDWDPLSLLVALDPVPSVNFDLDLPGWTPTIQLSAYLRRIPAPGPLRVRMHGADITNGRMDETVYVWDSKDRLVAQATQLAAIRMPS
ncbi:Thioesterase-like superfamily protein [Streptosporangium subroseum]|uniref:Thioesterase-like superfamily protein n=1 Tax=Streptosporangium subroseum TaxID=106412 RepID=A0A239LJZ2_9ACTN|nr:thioesterase family protein [Streptosporangium subroseum]SNT30791.1 Thioesterase-like superfamily protein [Streptosporangium subroseum]